MKRWQSVLLSFWLVLIASQLASCVNKPVQPNGLGFPTVNRPQLLAPVFDSTKILDCLSAELHNAGADKNKLPIYLTDLPNTAGPKVGKIDLPKSLQPFVRASLDRISSGVRILSTEDLAPVRLSGSLYAANPFRVLENEFEALGLGLGSNVEAADVSIQLFWDVRSPDQRAKGFEQSGTGVTVNLRLYSAEQGASAFVITGGSNGLVIGRSRASQAASPHLALQSAVNVAVASLLRAMAARQWQGFVSSCDFGAEGRIVIHPETTHAPVITPLDVRMALVNSQLCAQVKPRAQNSAQQGLQEIPAGGLKLEIAEFRAEGIEVRRNTINVLPLTQLVKANQSICLPRGAFDERTEEVRYWFKSPDDRTLGGAGFFFQ